MKGDLKYMNKKLQVFVSSTYTDLIEERQAAVQAILDAGHIPAGMELFKAGKSQMKTIKKWIDESDVYMLILGGRYGSIDEESGFSYTELEYRYALSKNMPVFAIILEDSFLFTKAASMGKDSIFEKENIDKYDSFKKFVGTKVVKFVENIDQISGKIHAQLNHILNDSDYTLIGWVRSNNVTLKPEIASCNLTYEQLYTLLKQKIFIINADLIINNKNNKPIKINGAECFMKIYTNFSNGKKINIEQELLDSVFSYYIGLGLLNANHDINKPYTIATTLDGLKLFVYIYEKLLKQKDL